MADPAPATPAAPNESPAAALAKVEAQTQAQTAQAVAQDGASLDDAWAKAVAAEEGLSLEDGRGRDSKGKFAKDDGPEADGEPARTKEAPADAEGEAAEGDEPPVQKARKFSQAVREKARQNREQLARRQRLEEENRQLSQVAEQHRRDQELLERDPIAFYRSKGKSAEEISHILLNSAAEGGPDHELKTLKQQIAELKAQQERREAEEQARVRQSRNTQAWRSFMENQASNEADYPLMAGTPEPFVQFAATEVAKEIVAAGESLDAYDDEDFAQGVELWLQRHRRQQKAKAKGDDGTGSVERVQKAPAPRTAVPGLNGRRHAPRPDFKSLSLDQQDAALDDGWAKARSEEDAVRRGG